MGKDRSWDGEEHGHMGTDGAGVARQEEGVAFDVRLQSCTVQDLVSRSNTKNLVGGSGVQEASSLLSKRFKGKKRTSV